nr:hypothetical protein [Escherichia coli]
MKTAGADRRETASDISDHGGLLTRVSRADGAINEPLYPDPVHSFSGRNLFVPGSDELGTKLSSDFNGVGLLNLQVRCRPGPGMRLGRDTCQELAAARVESIASVFRFAPLRTGCWVIWR